MNYRVNIQNTRYGTISANVHQVAEGYVGSISAADYPDLPAHGPLPDEPLAQTRDEAIEQLRRALRR